ncbi:GMC family oxidoreductase [Paraburkholderia unamae]|uniref:Choline dehydrogenase-like flavoprotein n=1 Tax=Paraburkholderia unamae TaxID=219649 RepID=A0ABX5KE49_9BURK|nr:GMC family oxidoreductase N-terminal domain-containing protein [Paraburkholderia unamae]PVX70867.1 choline dehydrogenase-like flavoprotein [Paraburkholderia unamae]
METSFDYIVVGAGSAGCAVAGRLAQAGGHSVAVLEAGPHDHSAAVTTPLGLVLTTGKAGPRNYGYRTQRQPLLNERRGRQPRGRGLGGSSSINGMVYIRGVPRDYDRWAEAGCEGWSWEDVLPYFRRSQCNERNGGRDDALHGGAGPLNVADQRSPSPFSRYFLEAAQSAGYRYNPDFNGAAQEGVGYYQLTQRNGERWNAARAYLHGGEAGRLSRLPNLHVLTDTQAVRIVFEGIRATGVEVRRGDEVQTLTARREVIVSSGAFGSPQLLMASGIGPADHLRELGVSVVVNSPDVGRNLQEHVDVLLYQLKVGSTDLLGPSVGMAWRMFNEWRRYGRERTGMLTGNVAEAGGFFKSDAGLDDPDLQAHFMTAAVTHPMRWGQGYSCHMCVLRPHSRGLLRLASPDTREAPVIDLNMLTDPRDMEALIKGVHILKRIFDQPALKRFGGVFGDPHLRADGSDDDAIREIIAQRADTAFHPVGTCRMGSDEHAVVDPQLRVRGVEGLRVVDASIMPTIVGGNTNAPAIMIGEKAADLILGRRTAVLEATTETA